MFTAAVIEKLKYYVYLLQDPRNGEVFYVGKGTGNRVFYHLSDALNKSGYGEKLDRIREIIDSGQQVHHYILRHGLDESMAFELEAAMIDFLGMDNLSNVMGGHYSNDFGLKSVNEIISMYQGLPLITDRAVLLININSQYERTMAAKDVYECTRKSWVLGERRNAVKYAVAVYGGMTREVYEVRKWFPVYDRGRTRWGFKGRLAREGVRQELIHKSIGNHFKKGASNPIKYLNC